MLSCEELLNIKGGAITSTFLNSLSRFMDTIFSIGQSVGSSIRRLFSGKICKF